MEHYHAKSDRNNAQKKLLKEYLDKFFRREKVPWLDLSELLPCKVTLTRIAPRLLDTGDNLPMAFKKSRDVIADMLIPGLQPGRADDDPRIEWSYDQKKGAPKEYAIVIEIEKKVEED